MRKYNKPLPEKIPSGVAGSARGTARPKHKLRPKRRLSRAGKAVILASLFLLICLSGRGIVKGVISKFFVNAVPAQSSSILEDKIETDFIVLRQENVVSAPYSGTLETVCREGERVAKGTVVGYLVTTEGTSLGKKGRVPVVSPRAGILSYQTDGYEHICSPAVWAELDISGLNLQKGLEGKDSGDAKNSRDGKERMVEAGQNLFRIIDNLQPGYLYMEVKAPLPEAFRKKEIDIRLKKLDNLLIRGTIDDINQDEDKYRVLIQIPCLTELHNTRMVQGNVIVNKYRGAVVDSKVLVARDNVQGVYLLKNGQVAWQQIEIVGIVGSQAAVAGLKAGDWVITAPGLVKEGQRIYFFNKKTGG